MSRAFIREDVDPPERRGRKRSASGLPPGAVNYITSRGAARLKSELTQLRDSSANAERVAELEQILASIHVVEVAGAPSSSVTFGRRVSVSDAAENTETFTILGVNELDLEPDAVSWISPTGKKLLAAELGDRITLEDGRIVKIIKIESGRGT